MPSPIPEETRQAVLEDIASDEDLSTRKIADRHGVSESTVRKIAKDNGFTDAFTRANTENATRARVADMKAQRAELAATLLEDALKLRERAWTAYTYYERSKDGVERVQLDLPPLAEVRNAYTALAIAIDKHVVLDKHDADMHGLAAVDAWLNRMIGD
jgi:transposase